MCQQFRLFQQEMKLHGLSPRTIQSYAGFLKQFQDYCGLPLDRARPHHYREFLLHLINFRKLSGSSVNVANSSIRFFAKHILKEDWSAGEVHYQKRRRSLPLVFSPEEVSELLQAAKTLKSRAILMTMYSAGLRVGELCQLRCEDIDSRRMTIFVRFGKGKKSRYVMLSKRLLSELRHYWKTYRPPRPLVFPNRSGGPLHSRAVQRMFQRTREAAGLNRRATPHTLRHSFATHLLENGTALPYIQSLMGHSSIKTTMMYLRISKERTAEVQSPLDKLRLLGF